MLRNHRPHQLHRSNSERVRQQDRSARWLEVEARVIVVVDSRIEAGFKVEVACEDVEEALLQPVVLQSRDL